MTRLETYRLYRGFGHGPLVAAGLALPAEIVLVAAYVAVVLGLCS